MVQCRFIMLQQQTRIKSCRAALNSRLQYFSSECQAETLVQQPECGFWATGGCFSHSWPGVGHSEFKILVNFWAPPPSSLLSLSLGRSCPAPDVTRFVTQVPSHPESPDTQLLKGVRDSEAAQCNSCYWWREQERGNCDSFTVRSSFWMSPAFKPCGVWKFFCSWQLKIITAVWMPLFALLLQKTWIYMPL